MRSNIEGLRFREIYFSIVGFEDFAVGQEFDFCGIYRSRDSHLSSRAIPETRTGMDRLCIDHDSTGNLAIFLDMTTRLRVVRQGEQCLAMMMMVVRDGQTIIGVR